MASNAAAGLPAADVPGELRAKVEKVLENEPEHVIPNVGWQVDAWDRNRSRSSASSDLTAGDLGAIALVLIETVALQLGPILTQIAIDDGVRANDRTVIVTVAIVYVGAVIVAALLGWARGVTRVVSVSGSTNNFAFGCSATCTARASASTPRRRRASCSPA